MKLNFEGLEMQKNKTKQKKTNIPTDGAQRVYEKNGDIYLVIMFTSRVIVIKMSKMLHILYFLLMVAKYQSSRFGQKI